jgi:hypothetical protein
MDARRTRHVAALVALALSTVACGDGGGNDVPSGAAAANDSSATPQTGAPSNGAAAKQGVTCGELGDKATVDGVDLECQLMQDGLHVWQPPAGQPMAMPAPTTLAGIFSGPGGCDASSTVERYSAPVADPANLAYVYPLGGLIGNHITPIDHIYFYYPDVNGPRPAGSYLITSPADGRVVAIEDFQKSNGYPFPDHRVIIEHSCSLYSVFIHVGPLSDAIASKVVDGRLTAPVPVKAGDVISDDSANPGFDFSTFDETVTIPFANPASYEQAETWKPYTADSLEYFAEPTGSAYKALSLRAVAPEGGTLDLDRPGTAQGNWFQKDTNGYRGKGEQTAAFDNHGKISHGYWDTHLAFAPHPIDTTSFIYSIGDWAGCPCQLVSVGNVDPSTIVPSATPTVLELSEFQYYNADGTRMDEPRPTRGYTIKAEGPVVGVVAIQLNADGTMTIEKMPGATSATAFTGFTDAAITYVR